MLRLTFYALWIAPAIVFVFLASLMVRRGTRKQFPFFFAYVVYQVLSFGVQFYTYHRQSQTLYFYTYWTTAALSIGIAFAVLHEVFVELFRPFAGLRDFGGVLFRWAALVLVVIALLMAMTSPVSRGTPVMAVTVSMERSIRAMQCGMVLLMMLCAPRFGLRYRQRVFGVAVGFGLIAAVDLIASAAVASLGQSAALAFNLARMGVYNLSALLWTGYFLAPEPERVGVEQLAHTDRWNFAMSTMGNADESVPAVPMIVDAVERVWRKSNGHAIPQHADQ